MSLPHYRRVAIYVSVLYGEDFVQESIRSILPHVDRVFVVMTGRPWGDTRGVIYKGEWIPWPEKFDESRERILALADPRVELVDDYCFSPFDQFRRAYAVARERASFAEHVFTFPDCVFSAPEAEKTFRAWDAFSPPILAGGDTVHARVKQVELWKTPEWMVRRGQWRTAVTLCRARGDRPTWPSATYPEPWLMAGGSVHNLGFCMSEKNMRWKLLTAIAYSPVVGESPPDPNWYERKWLSWHPERNNQNLEIALGSEADLPHAEPYAGVPIAESLLKRFPHDWPNAGVTP